MTEPTDFRLSLSPLQGYTDAVYRNAHQRIFGGVDLYYTPFVRVEKRDEFRNRDVRDIDPALNEVPVLIPQLLASTPDELRLLAGLFREKGYTRADINWGCPFPVLVRRHKGCGILPYREEVESVLTVLPEFPDIRFSVKMRLGWESEDECLSVLPLLNDSSVTHITLHARLGKQQYKGEADTAAFGRFYAACDKPLFYNGDVTSVQEIDECRDRFPRLAGIAAGRGILSRPSLAAEWKRGTAYSREELYSGVSRMHEEILAAYTTRIQGGEHQLLTKMKSFWEYLLPEADKKLHKRIFKSNRLSVYREAVNELLRL